MKKKTYAIVDIETTGGSSRYDRITEIGIVLHDGEKVLDHYQSLINPERSIPEHITRLTGISNEMVADAPRFFEIAKDIVEWTQGHIFVAHNVRFDYSFLRAEFERLGYTFSRRKLCTVKLSRKMLPGLPSYSLGKLIQSLGIEVDARHRALADAQATAELLGIILAKEASETALNDLVNLGIKETQLPPEISLGKLHELPEECGVYYFHNEDGQVVYVGKSKNIKKRVMQHFSKTTVKANTLYRHVRDITFELTGSELIALLLESYEIKRIQPFINRAQRLPQFPFTIQSFLNEKGYLNFEVVRSKKPRSEAHEILAEFPRQASARGKLARLVEDYQLCRRLSSLENNVGSCFYHQINLCRGACMGIEDRESYNRRALQAMEKVGPSLQGNFFLIDQGRSRHEQAVVWVENGVYRGFGYLDEEQAASPPESWKDAIRSFPSNPDVLKIIHYFIAKKEVKQVNLEENPPEGFPPD
jgi:DNA polymerase-3 subunit epsilon